MTSPALDDRTGEVLKSLIQAHIATGEPVGSESLSRLLNKPLSPATVRNIMADLERLGLLDHPHTSAGRVPTDEGYRYYVDALMARAPLAPRDAAAIRTGLRSDSSPQEVLESACHLLSSLSHNVAFVLAPDIARTTFRHVDLVRLPHPRVLVVIVAQSGLVTNKVVEVEEQLTQDDLQACANYLNAQFAGMRLAEVRGRLLELMSEEKALYDQLLKNVVSVGERVFSSDGEGGNVLLDGTSNMLEKPEFEDLPRMRALFKTFEEKGRLVKILNACLSDEGIRILIGHEHREPELRETSLVAASYPLDGEAWGVGVLGSTRMEYARVIALVDHVAREVTRALREIRA
jgi:heat-inducible transcriptional repressor